MLVDPTGNPRAVPVSGRSAEFPPWYSHRFARAQRLWRSIGVLTAVVVLTLLTSCVSPGAPASGDAGAVDPMNDALAPLSVAVLPITDVVPFYVAAQEGYFRDAGIEIELIPVSSGAERDTVVQTGAAECALTDINGVVLTNAGDANPLKIISTARQASSEQPVFFLLASPQSGITTPDQLQGATIAISENTIIDYWTDRMLDSVGLDPAAIEQTNVPAIPVRLELILSGQVDAAILPDPLASLAMLRGAPLVLNDASNPEIAVSVIVCRQDAIDAHPASIDALIAGWDQAVQAINADPEAHGNVLIENTRVPEPLQGQYTLPQFAVESIPSENQVQDVVEWSVGQGLIETSLTYLQVVDPSHR
jgi:NitT/TauT family transport system substrate-binding protein